MRNERGTATVMILALLPMLLAAAAVVGASLLILRADTEARHLCRTEALSAQEIAADRAHKLLAMNPRAKALRDAREAAEKAVELAPPAAKPAAVAALAAVKLQQTIFGAEQRKLFLEGLAASKLRPRATTRRIELALRGAEALQESGGLTLSFRAKTTPGAFDLRTEPQASLTPDYRPAPRFEEKQVIRIEWNFLAKALLPKWTHDLVGRLEYRVGASCQSLLKKNGDEKWTATLREPEASSVKL